MKRWKKLAFAGVVWCVFFGGLELALRVAGFQTVTATTDPYSGFSRQIPLLTRVQLDGVDDVMQTANNKLVWFNAFEFPAKKPANTKRVFCLGGSTTYGRPWDDRTSFAGWLREFLPVVSPDDEWEVINAGGISYASYRVAEVMRELTNFEPDLFVVYTGQNEFLENRTFGHLSRQSTTRIAITSWAKKTAIYSAAQSLLKSAKSSSVDAPRGLKTPSQPIERSSPIPSPEVDERLNHTIGPTDYVRDDKNALSVERDFEANLHRMADIASGSGAQLLLITPASNESGCEPFKSDFSDDASEQDVQSVRTTLAKADADNASSLGDLNNAIQRQPRYAELHYRRGLALLRQEQQVQALASFRRAIDEDVCPLRATTRLTQIVRDVAARRSVAIVDFETKLRSLRRSDDGGLCFGSQDFVDHVHPTIEVHQQLAVWIIDEMQAMNFVDGKRITPSQVADIDGRVRSKLDRRRQAVAFRNLAKLWNWCGRFESCERAARQCLATLPRDSESRYLLAESLMQLSRFDEAIEQYELLFQLDPNCVEAFIPAGLLYTSMGEWEAAEYYLSQGLLVDPQNGQALIAIAFAQSELERVAATTSVAGDDFGNPITGDSQ